MISLETLRDNPPVQRDTIIVGAVSEGSFNWYCSDGQPWRNLDDQFDDFRELRIYVDDDRVRTRTLRRLVAEAAEVFEIANAEEKEEILSDFYPSLYFDFDNREVIEFVEYPLDGFHQPGGWRHRVDANLRPILPAERYWVVEGIDLFNRH